MYKQNISTNDEVVKRLKDWIIIQENENLKTKDFSDSKMVSKIKERIEEEVQCYLNQ